MLSEIAQNVKLLRYISTVLCVNRMRFIFQKINKNVRNRERCDWLASNFAHPARCDNMKLFYEAETPCDFMINHRDFISICRRELFNCRFVFLECMNSVRNFTVDERDRAKEIGKIHYNIYWIH